jgi:hypothetical protein
VAHLDRPTPDRIDALVHERRARARSGPFHGMPVPIDNAPMIPRLESATPWLLASSAVALLGCGGATQRALRTRAASDLQCAEADVSVVETGAHGYRAWGCGRERRYTCRGTLCQGDSAVVTLPAPTRVGGEDPATALVRATHAQMRECVHGSSDITLDVDVSPEGEIRPLEIHERLSPHEGHCISTVAHGASSATWAGAGRLTLRYGESPPPTPAEPEQPFDPAVVRASIDARRAMITACAPGAPIALEVEWSAEGAIAVRLRDRPGSAEEGCVQAVLATERIEPAPGTSGTLLHVLEGG